MAKGNSISKEAYCRNCEFRFKMEGKTMCKEYNVHITESIKYCRLLKPFDKYKLEKSK